MHLIQTLTVGLIVLALSCLHPGTSAFAADGSQPVKIVVAPASPQAKVGKSVAITLTLVNAKNGLAKAPKALEVVVLMTAPSGKKTKKKVTFEPQQSSAKIKLKIRELGIYAIHAKQPELRGDDTFVVGIGSPLSALSGGSGILSLLSAEPDFVARAETNSAAPSGEVSAGAGVSVPNSVGLSNTVNLPSTVTPTRPAAPAASTPDAATAPELPAAPVDELATANAPDPPAAAATTDTPEAPTSVAVGAGRIQLLHRPTSRQLMADGTDSGTILAYLVDTETAAGQDIAVHLVNSQGELVPDPLIIKAGEFLGAAELTAEQVGEVTVTFVHSIPRRQVETPADLAFSFGPPIVQFVLRASPKSIFLLEPSELVVELRDADDTPTATDRDRTVSLVFDQGHGNLEATTLTIPAGQSTVRTKFDPIETGLVTIAASTPNLLSQAADIDVGWPVLPLILSALGGLLGGIADHKARRGRLWPIALGAVTGFLLFWGIAIGLVEVLPSGYALNPISAFAVSFIGGMAGTDVIKMLLKRFGLPA